MGLGEGEEVGVVFAAGGGGGLRLEVAGAAAEEDVDGLIQGVAVADLLGCDGWEGVAADGVGGEGWGMLGGVGGGEGEGRTCGSGVVDDAGYYQAGQVAFELGGFEDGADWLSIGEDTEGSIVGLES